MGNPTKILIVDDEEIIADVLKRRFERNGFIVYSADTGENAITFLEKNPVDLVICDVKIPKPRTAEDVFRASRQNNPDSKFVAMSGSLRSDQCVQSVMDAGAALFIKKPFTSLNDLTAEIVKILQ